MRDQNLTCPPYNQKVLRVFANAILDEMEENENFVMIPGAAQQQQQQSMMAGAPSYKVSRLLLH